MPAKETRIARWLRLHLAVIVSGWAGLSAGLLIGTLLAGGVTVAVAATLAGVATAALAGVAQELITKAGKSGAQLVAGRKPGQRRIGPERSGQTRVMAHAAGQHYEREKWVDLTELDHRGFYYGVAESPTYIPLYGNGLVALEQIEIMIDSVAAAVSDESREARELLDTRIAELRDEHQTAGRSFYDGPMVRLRNWQPPVGGHTPLRLQADVVGHQTYCAATSLLKEDAGSVRGRFGISARNFDNPMVHGALGVELAVVTTDEKLVLGHRGQAAVDYRDQIVVSFGEGLHPEVDSVDGGATVDPWKTVQRGLEEELGIEVNGRTAIFTALGAELSRMDPDLLGYIRIPYSSSEVQGSLLRGRVRDRWETQTLTFIDFSASAAADLLGGPLRRRLTPATAMNLVFAISHAFGESAAEEAFAR